MSKLEIIIPEDRVIAGKKYNEANDWFVEAGAMLYYLEKKPNLQITSWPAEVEITTNMPEPFYTGFVDFFQQYLLGLRLYLHAWKEAAEQKHPGIRND